LKLPAFDRLQKAIFTGRTKTVVVWKLDRISRCQRDGVNLLADWCERGARVVAVTQQVDLSGAVGRMVASVLFGLAEIESEYRRERQAAGHDQGPTAPCPGTPWPRPHGAGDRHSAGRQLTDRLPVPGHGTGVVIM
jgi:DNA invertase Pin-like site-specific DNA recombinase